MRHNHITRDIKPLGQCPACDEYHDRQIPKPTPPAPQSVEQKQLSVAIECLEKYRTLVIEKKNSEMPFRLGKHAEDALNLMAAIRQKTPVPTPDERRDAAAEAHSKEQYVGEAIDAQTLIDFKAGWDAREAEIAKLAMKLSEYQLYKQKCDSLIGDVERLERELAEMKADTPAMCAYCSFELPKGAKLEDLQRHISRCEFHPLVKQINDYDARCTHQRVEIDRLTKENMELRDTLKLRQMTILELQRNCDELREELNAARALVGELVAKMSKLAFEKAELSEMAEKLAAALEDWVKWEHVQIVKDGPYVGKQINELIKKAEQRLAEWAKFKEGQK